MGRVAVGLAMAAAAVTCAVAASAVVLRARRHMRWRKAVQLLADFEEACATPVARLKQLVDALVVEMNAGLASDGGSKLKMLLTFVSALPTGVEKGAYYALDLGGTNFRVVHIQLGDMKPFLKPKIESHTVPEELVTGTHEDLFDFLAVELEKFLENVDNDFEQKNNKRVLGFTFSFPVRQISVASGVLLKWTKGFAIKDAIGKDVGSCLQVALEKRGLNMNLEVLVNDTVGTLALGHYFDKDTMAAVILGTGTNACYVEQTDAVIKCQGLLRGSGSMVINMEWGNFWSSHLPRTPYDIDLDDESSNRNEQCFEKMISGKYLGEIVRRVLVRVARESDIFGDNEPGILTTPFVLRTPLMAEMHEDDTPNLRVVARILKDHFKVSNPPIKFRRLVVRVCDTVARRSARLVASGIVGILKKMGRDGSGGAVSSSGSSTVHPRRTVVAVEGSLYSGYSVFREYLHEALFDILGDEVAQNVVVRLIEDGPGVGAALLAAANSLDDL